MNVWNEYFTIAVKVIGKYFRKRTGEVDLPELAVCRFDDESNVVTFIVPSVRKIDLYGNTD